MAFPTTGLLDQFGRADGSLGASWVKLTFGGTGDWAISSQRIYNAGSSLWACYFWNTSYSGNAEAYFTIPVVSGDFGVGIHANVTSAQDDCYDIYINPGSPDTWTIERADGGAWTALGASFTQDLADGCSIGLDHVDGSLSAYYKASGGSWSTLATRTGDTTYTAGYPYIYAGSDGTWRMDDFGGGTVVAAASTRPFRRLNVLLRMCLNIFNSLLGRLFQ